MKKNKSLIVLLSIFYLILNTCYAQDTVFCNNGALIHVEEDGLICVGGTLINKDNAGNTGEFDNSGLISLKGDWINNSSGPAFINNSPGTVNFKGVSQCITGNTETEFFHLTFSSPGIKTFKQNATVKGSIDVNNAHVKLDSNKLTIDTSFINAIDWNLGFINTDDTSGCISRETDTIKLYEFPLGVSDSTGVKRIVVSVIPANTNLQKIDVGIFGDGFRFSFNQGMFGSVAGTFTIEARVNNENDTVKIEVDVDGNADIDSVKYFDLDSNKFVALPDCEFTITDSYILTLFNIEPLFRLKADAGVDRIICNPFGENVLGGDPTATGGHPPYTYAWHPAENLNDSTRSHPIADPSVTDDYIVIVTDDIGCTATDTVTVTADGQITADAGVDTAIIAGESIAIGGSPTATGATSYAWAPSATLNDTTLANPIATPTITTTYTVIVTNSSGCVGTDVVTVKVLDLDGGSNQIICEGTSVALGATGAESYFWYPSTGLSNVNISNPTAAPTTNTTYYVVGTTGGVVCQTIT